MATDTRLQADLDRASACPSLLDCRDLDELQDRLRLANLMHWIQYGDKFTPAHRRATGPQTPTQA